MATFGRLAGALQHTVLYTQYGDKQSHIIGSFQMVMMASQLYLTIQITIDFNLDKLLYCTAVESG